MKKQYIILFIAICVIGIVSWVVYDNGVFRVKSVSPSVDDFSTSAIEIVFTFSQPIKSVGGVIMSTNNIDHYVIDDKKIIIFLNDLLQENKSYSLELKKVDSKWFNKSLDDYNFTFKPRYIDFNNLPIDQQKASINKSSSGQIDDPFLNNSFPIITNDYEIEAKNAGDGKTIYVYVTFLKEVPDYDNGGKVTQLSNSEAGELQKKAFKTIQDNNGDPNKYTFIYSNNYLNSKNIK